MGLEDFTGDSDPDDELKEELSKNSPPEADKWRKEEPGSPNWLSLISGEIEKNDIEELEGDEVLIVEIESVDSTAVKSTRFISLDEAR